jgi:uncharacterized protein YkwD
VLVLLSVFFFIGKYTEKPPAPKEDDKTEAVSSPLPTVVAPPAPEPSALPPAPLTASGIISFTNRARQDNGLSPLDQNHRLDLAAEDRVRDMFEKQYWAHVSPTGQQASDSAKRTGYAYRLIGENIAKGLFSNDEHLVKAWLNSPGHRENIMKEGFRDIGVAAGRGIIEGQEGWIAVQLFGRQRPDCTPPNDSLLQLINAEKQVLEELKSRTASMFEEIESERSQGFRTQVLVNEHNRKVQEYNQLIVYAKARGDACRQVIERYNAEVSNYRNCMER